MWAKVANAFRRGDGVIGDGDATEEQNQYRDGRPSNDESASDSAGPPDSPSKNGKRAGLLRRGSRLLDKENGASLSLAKRVKSTLHFNSNLNESNMSLNSNARPELGGGAQPVAGSVRSIFGKSKRPSAMQMQAVMTKSEDTLNRYSEEAQRPSSPSPISPISPVQAQAPLSPLDARQFGSVRSILRDRNTPGSGQNVRFFSRDAYRLISPNTSITTTTDNTGSGSGDMVEVPFMQRIQEMSPDRDGGAASQDTTRYLSANSSPGNMFSPATTFASANSGGFENYPTATSTPYVTPEASQAQGNVIMPPPPPQLTGGIFDFSAAHEHGVHSIHATGEGVALRDDAVEVDELGRPVLRNGNPTTIGARPSSAGQTENRVSSHSTASSTSIATPHSIINGSESSLGHRMTDSEENTRFYSLGAAVEDVAGGLGGEKQKLSGRTASSLGLAKVFHKRENSSSSRLDFPGSGHASSRVRALSERVFSRPSLDEKNNKPDADAATPQAKDEPDPFSADASNYYNKAAGFPKTPPRIGHIRTDSVVSGVSMNSGMSVSAISHHSSTGSHSSNSHTSATRTLATSRGLGTPDDETITALRAQLAFHRELAMQYEADIRARDAHATLMSQKLHVHEAEAERRAKAMRGMRKRVAELERAAAALEEQAEKNALETFERSVFDGVSGDVLKAMKTQMVELEREKGEVERREKEARAEREKLLEEVKVKEEALRQMKRRIESGAISAEQGDVAKVQQEAAQAAAQYQEIELAWAEDRARLITEVQSLQKEINSKTSELSMLKSEVEAQWNNTEKLNERFEKAQREVGDIEREREHLKNVISELEARVGEMEVDWTESENRKAQAESELNATLKAKAEVERERDQLRQEFEQSVQSANAYEVEELRSELATLRRELARMQTDHARSLSEAEVRASDAIELRNETARRQAAANSEARELREKLAKMQEENEKLRMNVNTLKHQSAGQDVKILQLEKMHDQDTEDKLGLNIALDSKQQELELLKRTIGVRGTAGSTPAVASRTGVRRDSGAFKTPMPLRPVSSLSDTAAAGRRPPSALSDTDKSGKMAGTAKPTARLGKARVNVGSLPSVPTTTIRKAKTPRLSDTSLSAPPGGRSNGRARSGTAGSDTPKPSIRQTATVARRAISPNSSAIVPGRRASIAISGIESMRSDTVEIGSESDMSGVQSQSDKENETPRPLNRATNTAGSRTARRMSMQPLVVPA